MLTILVSGSRDWHDETVIYGALDEICTLWGVTSANDVLVVHGACPTGADHIADMWAKYRGVRTETYPADWQQYGKRAGYLRNKDMVDRGADVALVFNKNNSKGTSMLRDLAVNAGINIVEYLS